MITIRGTINPALPANFSISNLASITTSSPEMVVSNNTSRVVINQKKIYLPVVKKNIQ